MNTYISEEARQIHHDVKHCEPEELKDLYGIELCEEGTVYDHTYQTTHRSVDAWIEFSYSEDHTSFEKFSKHYDDDSF